MVEAAGSIDVEIEMDIDIEFALVSVGFESRFQCNLRWCPPDNHVYPRFRRASKLSTKLSSPVAADVADGAGACGPYLMHFAPRLVGKPPPSCPEGIKETVTER